jgi:hypothetical protein
MEMSIFFQELLPQTVGNFVGGPKSVPICFTLAAVASWRGEGDANREDRGFAARYP